MQRGLMMNNNNASWGHPQSLTQISSPHLHLRLVFIAVSAFCRGTYSLAGRRLFVPVERRDVNHGWMQTLLFFYWSNSLENSDGNSGTDYSNSLEKVFISWRDFPDNLWNSEEFLYYCANYFLHSLKWVITQIQLGWLILLIYSPEMNPETLTFCRNHVRLRKYQRVRGEFTAGSWSHMEDLLDNSLPEHAHLHSRKHLLIQRGR